MKICCIISLFFLNFLFSYSQEKTTLPIAKLRSTLRAAVNDTSKVAQLREIGTFYLEESSELAFPYAIDSALAYSNASRKLAESIHYKPGMAKTYLLQSKIYSRRKKFEEAKALAKKAIATYTEINSKTGIAMAHLVLGSADDESEDMAEPVANTQKALQLYKEAGNKRGQADALYYLGYLTMTAGDMDKGRQQLLDALALYKAVGYKNVQRLNSLIALNYNQIGKSKEAVTYGIESIRIIDERNDTSQEAAEVYNYMAIIYNDMHDDQKSLDYLQKADQISVHYNNLPLVIMLESNMIQMLMKLKRNKEALVYLKKLEAYNKDLPRSDYLKLTSRSILAYCAIKDYKSAEKYINRAMEMSAKLPPYHSDQNILYPAIVSYLFSTGKYEVCRQFTTAFKTLSEKSKNPKMLAEAHAMLFKLDSVQSRFADALKNYKLASSYENSLLNTTKDKAFQELQVKYDSDKKDKDLLLKEENNKLLRKQGELQKTQLSQANLLQNISLVGILSLFIILSLVYKSFYSKQKSNRLLQAQKLVIDEKNMVLQKLADEREWLLREIHHRVKNNLQIVMSLLNTQSHYLTDEAAVLAISSSQHRIHSMSLIHKKLYQSDSLVAIHMPTYINELIEYFRISFDTGQRIRFHSKVDEIHLDIGQAVPIGLILNEAITNAIKHAFPDRNEGEINIKMIKEDSMNCGLLIRDNGIGYAPPMVAEVETLGAKLIQGLTGDINGAIENSSSDGYCIKITFPIEENKLEKFG